MEDSKIICDQPNVEHLKVLRDSFGHKNFKIEQWKVIRAIIYEKRDCLIVVGTGFGKSLIYQFPPVFLRKISVVISPLISLMEDQVLALQRRQINACLLGSMQKNTNIDLKKYQVIYLTPEYLNGETGRQKLETIKHKICVIAIDECHCITHWGTSFRPKYRKLVEIRSLLPNVPLIGLTATATEHCQQDVCQSLRLKNPLIISAELNRPNLQLFVFKKNDDFVADIKKHIERVDRGAVIIYVLRRRETEEYSAALNGEGFNSRPYHAGMRGKDRHQVLKGFAEGTLRFIVATIAFGMGIDRADVRLVIHYGTPRNVESYYQESGRAGRDGAPSKCIIFWKERDFQFYNYWLNRNQRSDEYKEHCKRLLDKMKGYLESVTCRRMTILRYFDSTNSHDLPIHELCCDNCIDTLHRSVPLYKMYRNVNRDERVDVSSDARLILRLVKSYQRTCSFRLLKLLIGEFPNTSNQRHPLELFTEGKSKQEAWWNKLFHVMWGKKIIDTNQPFNYGLETINDFRVTNKGMKLLRRTSKKLTLHPSKDILEFLDKTNSEFFIEDAELKCKPRQRPLKVPKVKLETSELFNFGNSAKLMVTTQSRNVEAEIEGDDKPSTSNDVIAKKPEETDEEEERDYYMENTKFNFDMSRRPTTVDLDDLLSFIENYDENRPSIAQDLKHESQDESFAMKIDDGERCQQTELLNIETSRVDLLANCSLKIALKRLGEYYDDDGDDEELPFKLARVSQEM